MNEQRGVVYLVGAGPGDPGLLTRRGEALLRQAEVVVFDRLASPAVMALCNPAAEQVFVGKEGGGPSFSQERITELLVEYGRSGRRVVRLKGGDSFIFGRGGEEALALRQAGIAFEVVPGVTSAIAAPAYAGIPVTHRGLATSVSIITGHEDPTKPASQVDWQSLARGADTLVVLMGIEQLDEICTRLLAGGRPADQPAALVRWGTMPEQQTLVATVGTIADQARRRQLRPPAVLVVGEVASLAQQLAWFERRPLFGRRVLVTRAREQASSLAERLTELGAQPLEFPTIRIEPLEDTSELDAAVSSLSSYDWVVLTSANGVTATFERLAAQHLDARAFGGARVAAIGTPTSEVLAQHGIRADFVPTAFTSEAIAAELTPRIAPGQRLLLLRADIAPRILEQGLAARGAEVENVVAYRTRPDVTSRGEIRRRLELRQVDVVTLTSSSTVRNLVDGLDGQVGLLESATIACIGPVTAKTAGELGLRVDLVASVHTVDGLVDTLVEALADRPRPLEVR